MARLIYPDPGSQLVYQRVGTNLRAANGQTATVYMDATGTTLANIAAYDPNAPGTPGAVISGSTLTVDTYSRLPSFWGPATGEDTLWVTVNNGPLVPVNSYYDPRIDAAATSAGLSQEIVDRTAADTVLAASVVSEAAAAYAAAVQRDNHTGTQVAATISDLADATGAVVLPVATAVDDTTAINTILAANAGKLVVGRPGSSYLISAPLVVYSGTTLDMTGCTITLIAGSNCNMLQNRAVSQVRRALDAVTTATSTTLTSATAAFVAGDVGKAVTIQGAGAAGVPLTTTIASYTNATTVTLTMAASTSVTGQYVAIGTRDSYITIIGGYWDRASNGSVPDFTFDAHSLRLRHVDHLTIRDLTCVSSQAANGKYQIAPGDCTDITVRGIRFPVVGSDGLHFNGPCSQVTVRDIVGGSLADDLVSLTARDTFDIITDCAGDITDVVIDGIMYQSSSLATSSALKLVAGQNTTQTSNYVIRNLRARNITGPCRQGVVTIGDVVPIGGNGGLHQDLTLESVKSLGGGKPVIYLRVGLMDRVAVRDVVPYVGDEAVVRVSGTVTRLLVEDVQWDASSSATQCVYVNAGSVAQLLIANVVGQISAASALVKLESTATIGRLQISNVQIASSATSELISYVNTVPTITSVHLTNIVAAGVNYPLGSYRSNVSVAAANVTGSGMTAWIRARDSAVVTLLGASGLTGDVDFVIVDAAASLLNRVNVSSVLQTDSNALAGGEETMSRLDAGAPAGAQLATGTMSLTYFTARKTESIPNVVTLTTGTGTSSPTLCRVGIYSVATNGDLTLVASTATDTALWSVTNTRYNKALSSSFSKVAGRRYAVGLLFVGTTGPTLAGIVAALPAECARDPRITGAVTGQSDLPSSVATGSVTTTSVGVYAAMI